MSSRRKNPPIHPLDLPDESPLNPASDPFVEPSFEPVLDKPTDRAVDPSIAREGDHSVDPKVDRSADSAAESGVNRPADHLVDRSSDPALQPSEERSKTLSIAATLAPSPESPAKNPEAPIPDSSDSPDAPPPPPQKKRPFLLRAFFWLLNLGLVLLILGLSTAAGVVWWFSRDLPRFDSLQDYHPRQTTRVLASDGSEMGDIFRDLRRTVISVDELAPVMVQALVSAEDAKFFEHTGVDYLGIVKAVVSDVMRGSRLRGASTITQQTVKTFLLSGERKISRKIREAILAHRLEQNLSKDDILFLYLNQIEFGAGRAGIEEAARYYFGKSARDLELNEAAVLASIPKSPNGLNPRRNPKRAFERRNYVLRRMAENGYIPEEVARRESQRPIELAPLPDSPPAGGYYLSEVRRILSAELGQEALETGGLVVKTAMHPRLQQDAEESVIQSLREVDRRHGYKGPLGKIAESDWEVLEPWIAPPPQDDPSLVINRTRSGTLPDLRLVDTSGIDAAKDDEEQLKRIAGAVRWLVPREGVQVVTRVGEVSKTSAQVYLGGHSGNISLKDTTWARKWNPQRWIAPPKSLGEVLKKGDLVLVRVLSVGKCKSPGFDPKKTPLSQCPSAELKILLDQEPTVEGALVAIEPTSREVLALVGGYSHQRSAFNRATQARRQSGSAFKPFVYAAALESGRLTALSTVYDTPELIRDRWTGKPWEPRNYDRNAFDGPMSLKDALALSKNTVAVKLIADMARGPGIDDDSAQDLGLSWIQDLAYRAGIDSKVPNSLTAALGSGDVSPMELVNAYTTLAALGDWAEPILIRQVLSPDGRVLREYKAKLEHPPTLPEHSRELLVAQAKKAAGLARQRGEQEREEDRAEGLEDDLERGLGEGLRPVLGTRGRALGASEDAEDSDGSGYREEELHVDDEEYRAQRLDLDFEERTGLDYGIPDSLFQQGSGSARNPTEKNPSDSRQDSAFGRTGQLAERSRRAQPDSDNPAEESKAVPEEMDELSFWEEREPTEHPEGRPYRGIHPGVAYTTVNLMRSVVDGPIGTGRAMAIGRPVAGKTGTTSDHRDAWFVGFTPELVAGAWVGFDDHSPLGPGETGGRAAGPMWRHFMLLAGDRLPRRIWEAPEGAIEVDIDPHTGLKAHERSPYLQREVFLRGTEPTEFAPAGDIATVEDFLRGGGP